MQPEKTKIEGFVPPREKVGSKDVKLAASPQSAVGRGEAGVSQSRSAREFEAEKMSRFGLSTVMTVGLIIMMMLAAFPTFIVFSIGMAPTFVGNFTQPERNSYRYISLAALNFAGVMPYILDLWHAGDKIEGALRIVTDVDALFVMYGAAALAVLSLWAAPQVAASFLSVMGGRRLLVLRKEQEAMIHEWGADVDVAAEVKAAQPGEA